MNSVFPTKYYTRCMTYLKVLNHHQVTYYRE
jgi:hypothetical protein